MQSLQNITQQNRVYNLYDIIYLYTSPVYCVLAEHSVTHILILKNRRAVVNASHQ